MAQKLDYVLLFPGNASSGRQWISAHVATMDLMTRGKTVGLMQTTGCNIYGVRNRCLAMKKHEKDQPPLGGLDYKNLVWVDSDNHISAEQIERLVSCDVDIAAGWYKKGPGEEISCGYRDMEYFKEEDKLLLRQPLKNYKIRPLTIKDIQKHSELIDVDYSGLGLMVMKKGVMESLTYPWFISWVIEWKENGAQMAEIITDDDGLCIQLQDRGFQIWVDPGVQIGHEKSVIL